MKVGVKGFFFCVCVFVFHRCLQCAVKRPVIQKEETYNWSFGYGFIFVVLLTP